jgi:predicted transcriptional regulator
MSTSNEIGSKGMGEVGLTASGMNRDLLAEARRLEVGEAKEILSEEQRQALEWLLTGEGATVKDAAEFAGVARSTVSRWLNSDPAFGAIYEAWRQQQEKTNEAHMVGLEASALDVIGEAIRQRRDVRAAEFVIKQMMGRRNRREGANRRIDE